MNRRLADGTYWTTGLANGLDNSPSLGDGYPDLTAQMAHDAETLGQIARVLGLDDEAAAWEAEQQAIGRALNAKLWSESMQIYATSLPAGDIIPIRWSPRSGRCGRAWCPRSAWQRWPGIYRIRQSFWRHHPIPSLAADAPDFAPAGDYWRGSTWAPTNYAAIKGFARAGCHALARATTLRHLQCLTEVLRTTGHIWENYCSERSERGNWSGPDYCWSTLGPIALLFEVVIGLQPLALSQTLRWSPPDEEVIGVRGFPLGPATVSVCCRTTAAGRSVEVETDHRFTLEIARGTGWLRRECLPGRTLFSLDA